MDFRLTPDAVNVISSGIDLEGWTPVPEHTAASVDLVTLELDGSASDAPEPGMQPARPSLAGCSRTGRRRTPELPRS